MKHFFVITGPSACGKTTLLQKGEEQGLWEHALKYSTRDSRSGEFFDDITHRSKDEIYASTEFNYRYIMNDNIYAFSSAEILSRLRGHSNQPSKNVAIVCSDLGIIRKLRVDLELKDSLVVLFVSTVPAIKQVTKAWLNRVSASANANSSPNANEHSTDAGNATSFYRFELLNELTKKLDIPIGTLYDDSTPTEGGQSFETFSETLQDLYEEYVDVMPLSNSYKQRIRNIDKFYYKYIEEIAFFDYTILNFFDPAQEGKTENQKMTYQVKSIINFLRSRTAFSPSKRRYSDNALFFICAPKRAGKAILFSNLNLISRDKIEIVRKIALREDKNTTEALKKGKGDGYGLSETYWMFDSKDDVEYKNLEKLKSEAGDEKDWDINNALSAKIQCLLVAANDRVNDLIKKNVPLGFSRQEYDFTKWYWLFQGNYYAVDTNSILSAQKHSIVISNIDQLAVASSWAEKANKTFVPIFLVYVDYEESSLVYHTKYDSIGGKKTNDKIFRTISDYYGNIGEFRHVILNNGIAEDVHDQISNIINQYK